MQVRALHLRDFRNYERADAELGERLTVVAGANGAGKTNLLEALYFACTGRSPRTSAERELPRHGAGVARVTLATRTDDGVEHLIEAGFSPGEERVLRVDGAPVDSLLGVAERPLVSVFLPDRLDLVKGAPAGRRAHLDSLVSAVWPARAATRAAYSRALAQRNALLARARGGAASTASLPTWDAELARHGAQLMADRAGVLELLAPLFEARGAQLGLAGDPCVEYRPRSASPDAEGLRAELAARHAADLERGFTAHGPHRDEVRLMHGGRALRTYGSQGQQRVGLLALLFAERDLLRAQRGRPPLMLLDDVMSELDSARRELLAELLSSEGQSLVTTTDLDHVPGARDPLTKVIEVSDGILSPVVPRVAA
ncbi:MAG: DNA replication/repair protein RecF [Actinomycetota bacterium]|nr:DNA replication/repair protein RecF [Actinomycetota bacterium]